MMVPAEACILYQRWLKLLSNKSHNNCPNIQRMTTVSWSNGCKMHNVSQTVFMYGHNILETTWYTHTHTQRHISFHSIGMCRMRRFLAVLRSFFHSSLLYTFSCHPFPPTILQSSLTSSGHLFLGLPLNLAVSKSTYSFGNSTFVCTHLNGSKHQSDCTVWNKPQNKKYTNKCNLDFSVVQQTKSGPVSPARKTQFHKGL
jgi:hypothetical protein